MKRLLLVRHGESIWNAEARIQGQSCRGLSPLGFAQAAATAAALAARYPEAQLVTSDLQRTRETVAPLAAALGATPLEDRRLRERSFGSWEGRLRREVMHEEADRWQRWLEGEDVVSEVGGESAAELADRVAPAFEELVASTPDGSTTIAVTHGGSIWNGLHRVLGLPNPTLGGVDNTSLSTLLGHADGLVLGSWNETGHLPEDLRSGAVARRPLEGQATSSDAPPVGR